MRQDSEKLTSNKPRLSVIEWIIEAIGFLQIMASPTIVGVIIGVLIYLYNPTIYGITWAIITIIIGLVVGIVWATRVWKKSSTISFMSKVNASPELDKD